MDDRLRSDFMGASRGSGRGARPGSSKAAAAPRFHCTRWAALRSLPALLLLLPLLFASAACDDGPRLRPLAPGEVILAFGDSLTYGTGAGAGESYPARLEALVQQPVVNAGVPGETTAEGVRRLPEVLAEISPGLLILCHGGNDFLRRTGEARAEANLRTMVAEARSRGIAVVLVGVPRPGLLLSAAPLYEEIAEEFRLVYVEDILADILGERDLKSDTIHPNAAGYRRLAEALAEALERAGAVRL